MATPPAKLPPSLGVLVAPCHVSPVYAVVVPIVPVKSRSEICVVADACLRPPKSGASGTARSTCTNATTLPRLLLPRLRFQRLSWPAVTRFPTCQRSRWPCPIKSNPPRRPESWASDRLQGRQRCHVGIPQSAWG